MDIELKVSNDIKSQVKTRFSFFKIMAHTTILAFILFYKIYIQQVNE